MIQLLDVQNLVKTYGPVTAVDGITFSALPGEVFGFLGPNGAGKTTTIKTCAGLLEPTEGDVTICGHSIVREPLEAKKLLGYVPENPFLYEKLTGAELLDFVAGIYLSSSPAERQEKVSALLDLFDMGEKGNDLIESYSKGMRQKIALAAAMVHDPAVLLLDEPTVGLDAISARHAKDLIRSHAGRGAAVLLTTHVMEIAERVCDRIAVIHRGQIIAIGTLDELRARSSSGSTLEDVFLDLTTEEPEDHGEEPVP